MDTNFYLQELYDMVLRTPIDLTINGQLVKAGEVIAQFDKISLANFVDRTSSVSARGGHNNSALVTWFSTTEVQMSFSMGIFSKTQFALMTNANLLKNQPNAILIPQREIRSVIVGDAGPYVVLTHLVDGAKPVFVYNNGTRLDEGNDYLIETSEDQSIVRLLTPNFANEILVDYHFKYQNNSNTISIGDQLLTTDLIMTARSRIKDDITGDTHTVLITIPKFRISQSLMLRLGRDMTPVMSTLNATALPTNKFSTGYIMTIELLETDLDEGSDITPVSSTNSFLFNQFY